MGRRRALRGEPPRSGAGTARLVAAAALLCVAATACTDPRFEENPADGGAPSVDGACGPGTPEPPVSPDCRPRRPPPRPVGCPPDADGGVDSGVPAELVFAIRDTDISDRTWSENGYDLDAMCTGAMGPAECVPPAATMRSHVVDGSSGIDNAYASIIAPLIASGFPAFASDFRAHQLLGEYTSIVRLRGWNGQPYDDNVIAAILYGVCGSASGEPDCAWDAPGAPRWDGTDRFFASDDSFAMGDLERPVVEDRAAYVADGVLVVRLRTGLALSFAGASRVLPVNLSDAVFTARIARVGAFPTLREGRLSARWSSAAILAAADQILCPTQPEDLVALAALRNGIGQAVDVMATSTDGAMTPAECDAITLGISFLGFGGTFGGVTPVGPIPDPCAL